MQNTGLWKVVLDNNEIYDITPFKKHIAKRILVDNAVTGLFIDSNQMIWIGTGRNGIFQYDPKTLVFEKLKLPSNSFFYTGIVKDKSGILWLGSSRGVTKIDFNRKPFVTHSLGDDSEDESRKQIYDFSKSIQNKNHVWLSTVKGLYLFDNKTNNLSKSSSRYRNLSLFDEDEIFTVVEDKNASLWIATGGDGLYSFNLQSGRLDNYRHKYYDNSTISHNIIHNLAMDKDENLWVATHEGLNYLKKGSDKFVSIPSFIKRKYDKRLIDKIRELRKTNSPASSITNVGDDANMSKEFVLRNDAKVIIYSIGKGLPQWSMVDYGVLEAENGDTLWNGGDFEKSFHVGGGLKNRINVELLDLKAGRYKLKYRSDDSHSVESYNDLPPQDTTS